MSETDVTITELAAHIAVIIAKLSQDDDGGRIELHCKGRGYIIKNGETERRGRIIEK